MKVVGGRKRKAWRLKKKYNKWFVGALQGALANSLVEMSNVTIHDELAQQNYDFMRLYK